MMFILTTACVISIGLIMAYIIKLGVGIDIAGIELSMGQLASIVPQETLLSIGCAVVP